MLLSNPYPIKRGLMVLPMPADQMQDNLTVLASWGANIIRWQLVLDNSLASTWTIDQYNTWLEEQLTWLDGSLALLQTLKVQVVLDMHTPVGGSILESWGYKEKIFADETYADAYVANWVMMAKRYKDQPQVWGYDLLNEPGCQESSKWRALAQKVAEQIRAVDTVKEIIVESIHGDPGNFKNFKPLENICNLTYSAHMYLPNSITFQGIPDASCNMIPIGDPYPSTTITKDTLINYLSPVLEFQKKYNLPIYIGEFSCARWSGYPNYENAYNYLQDCISIFEGYGWSWSYHAFREAGVWELEFDCTPCPDKCNPNCVQAFQDTPRKALMISAFSKNQT